MISWLDEHGERIPLTVESSNKETGIIAIVVQSVGKMTYQLNALDARDWILDVVGPLGKPSVIENFGAVAQRSGESASAQKRAATKEEWGLL